MKPGLPKRNTEILGAGCRASEMLSIRYLKIDSQIQQRVNHLNDDMLEQYIEDAGGKLPSPAVTVFVDGDGEYWLVGLECSRSARVVGNE